MRAEVSERLGAGAQAGSAILLHRTGCQAATRQQRMDRELWVAKLDMGLAHGCLP